MSDPLKPVSIAILGPGTVGSEVVRLLTAQAEDLAARVGAPLEIAGIYVRDTSKDRGPNIPRALLTDDASALVAKADVVVELMGGIEPARTLILEAIASGASVVTANKALLAQHGPELYEAADAANVDLYFEAAVAGAIPLVRPVRESLAGDHISRILGIVNGTTNYILDEMTMRGLDYDVALKQAQELGYAEADPTADVEGHDAAAKAAILASLAFHQRVAMDDVYCEGISAVTSEDVIAARETDQVIKLLAIAERTADGVAVRVHPALVPMTHPLAGVHGAFNAVFVEAESAGGLMFYGQGAGGTPTASAVLGDLVSVARHKASGGKGPHESNYAEHEVLPIEAALTRYCVRMSVEDRPGVLSAVAEVFARHDVGIEIVRQVPGQTHAGLILSTYSAPERDLRATVSDLEASDAVAEVKSVLRIEGE
ncbi:homoserine dehydrogenase [Demequina sp. SYSU T00039]|uniref:Homoserine dehydrogenase n=1 Tax=Demequina lignilytica TaxID=3051663 RepID=A0AAW7M4N5_9MICO|nr:MULTISPECIES: homoserine dehydrogenase [unclassified Demequina]MDN4479143.1 homoserine dehydrogenase [Demequina sp. SYSU T00039-1]MDN4489144.1 homoserine dehydrogenase [Demequina sp. SYSU T00039]MDN4490247.1 homoserine dehydrogenase [Demequina sp. SYSU T00068]